MSDEITKLLDEDESTKHVRCIGRQEYRAALRKALVFVTTIEGRRDIAAILKGEK